MEKVLEVLISSLFSDRFVSIIFKDCIGQEYFSRYCQIPISSKNLFEGSKKAVQVLTETQYNTVKTPYFEASTLWSEAQELTGDAKTAKETAAAAKDTEAQNALDAL